MIKKVLGCFIIIFAFMLNVKADCDSKEILQLNTEAANVYANYEMSEMVIDYDGNRFPELNIDVVSFDSGYSWEDIVTFKVNNITDNIYLSISNAEDNFVERVDYSKTNNGFYSFEVPDVYKIRNYVVKVYSNNPKCLDEELRTINVATPMYNPLSDMQACDGLNVYYCNKFITSPLNIDENYFIENAELIQNEENVSEVNDSSDNKNFILISFGIIGFLVVAIIITLIIKKKRRII